jgi:hypothetical protein
MRLGHGLICVAALSCVGLRSVAADTIPAPSISYVIGPNEVDPAVPDTTGHILADGVVSSAAPTVTGQAGSSNAQYVEFAPSAIDPSAPNDVTLQFNLGNLYALTSVQISYFKDSADQLPDPSLLSLSFSTDGTTINSSLSGIPFPTDGAEYTVQSPTFPIFGTGQYVNIEIDLPDNATSDLSEFTFSGFALPEPSTGVIFILAAGTLVNCHRSRRRAALLMK